MSARMYYLLAAGALLWWVFGRSSTAASAVQSNLAVLGSGAIGSAVGAGVSSVGGAGPGGAPLSSGLSLPTDPLTLGGSGGLNQPVTDPTDPAGVSTGIASMF
jgi:hypothetical protein